MICANCKNEIEDSARFCPYCGCPVNQEQELKQPKPKKKHKALRITAMTICISLAVLFGISFAASYTETVEAEEAAASLSDINVVAAKRAIEIADDYLNDNTKIATIASANMERAIEMMEPAETEESVEITGNVKKCMQAILQELEKMEWVNGRSGSMDTILQNRNKIAEYAGLS